MLSLKAMYKLLPFFLALLDGAAAVPGVSNALAATNSNPTTVHLSKISLGAAKGHIKYASSIFDVGVASATQKKLLTMGHRLISDLVGLTNIEIFIAIEQDPKAVKDSCGAPTDKLHYYCLIPSATVNTYDSNRKVIGSVRNTKTVKPGEYIGTLVESSKNLQYSYWLDDDRLTWHMKVADVSNGKDILSWYFKPLEKNYAMIQWETVLDVESGAEYPSTEPQVRELAITLDLPDDNFAKTLNVGTGIVALGQNQKPKIETPKDQPDHNIKFTLTDVKLPNRPLPDA